MKPLILLGITAAHFVNADSKMKVSNQLQNLGNVRADSALGNVLLSKARRLEQADEDVDFTWVAGYSLKFQGCHHINQWNEEADGEEDVRIQTKRLIRFRLCPNDYCSASNAGGCDSGYGDYIIDLSLYLEAYLENIEAVNENYCDYLDNNDCACDNDDMGDDDQAEDKCKWNCYEAHGMDNICMDANENPYVDDDQDQEKFQLQQYAECANWDIPNNNRRRKLNDADEIEYFIGPYCSLQGGVVYLGLFTDDTCTTFADEYGGTQTYESFVGEELPYSQYSIVGSECVPCDEADPSYDWQGQNDQQDEDQVIEFCEQIYLNSGKCEQNLGLGTSNNNACNYMEGIKIIRMNGSIVQGASSANKTASIFIGLFVVAFVLLAAYVHYLRSKVERHTILLSE